MPDAEVYELDLTAGWRAALLAFEAKQWCKSQPARLVAKWDAARPVETVSDISEVETRAEQAPVAPCQAADGSSCPSAAELDGLRERVAVLVSHPAARGDLRRLWPRDVPTFKHGGPTDRDQFRAVATLVSGLESQHRIVWPDAPPPPPYVPPEPPLKPPRPPLPDEGPEVDTAELKAAVGRLDAGRVERLGFFTRAAKQAGLSVSLVNRPSERRVAVGWALLELSRFALPDAEQILAAALGLSEVDYGLAVGLMTTDEACVLRDAAAAIGEAGGTCEET